MKTLDLNRLPDILTMRDGRTIHTVEEWETLRRPEIMEFFTNDVFGKMPDRPADLRFETISVDENALGGNAAQETVRVCFSGPYGAFSFPFYIYFPKTDKPCPVTLLICNRDKRENMDLTRESRTGFWPVESIVSRGYAACAYYVGDVDTDEDDGFIHGVQRVFTPERRPHDWATIAAWAWGGMRVMDWLEKDPRVDKAHVSVVGQSRGGKTSLFCAAVDRRFAAVFSSNSGCVGTALTRFKDGETLRQINTTFPYWFCDAFKTYNDRELEIPFDQHELMACIAPRLLYVTAATEDLWADPEAEYAAACLAEASYRLYGKTGVPVQRTMPVNQPICGTGIGFHNRMGEHDLTEYDWMRYLDFLESRRLDKTATSH